MLARIVSVFTILVVLSACSSNTKQALVGNPSKAPADVKSTKEVSTKYLVESNEIPTFKIIADSNIENRRASDRVFFAYDSAVLSSSAQKILDLQSAYLKQHPNVSVTIEGHCDERGTREYNLALGDRRAQSVKNYLISSGISKDRVSTISYGKERPAVVGSSSASLAENRRSETKLSEYR